MVLAHQNGANLCQWLPYGQLLAAKGYRVLALDFVGFGSSTQAKHSYVEDLTTAVTYLREKGATKVVLVGASMGGTMSLAAAAAIKPAVDGVVALSSPSTFDGVNVIPMVSRLTVSALFIAGEMDPVYAASIKQMSAAAPAKGNTLLIVPSYEHGVRLVPDGVTGGPEVRTAVETFLAAHAPLS